MIGVTVTTAKGNTFDISDLVNGVTIELISTDESYVGYYADVDGDRDVDGIIYADLCIGGSGTWNDGSWSSYSYDAIDSSSCKDYYISQTDYDKYSSSYGTNDVITVMSGSTGKDRFYVMALSDFTTDDYSTFYWYYTAYSNASLDNIVSYSTNDFGVGYENTGYVIDKWNSEEYGTQNARDIWGLIQDEYADGWFVPSKSEWACFGDEFEIMLSNYSSTFGLSTYCWSSSQYTTASAYGASFSTGNISSYSVKRSYSVRLSSTF